MLLNKYIYDIGKDKACSNVIVLTDTDRYRNNKHKMFLVRRFIEDSLEKFGH